MSRLLLLAASLAVVSAASTAAAQPVRTIASGKVSAPSNLDETLGSDPEKVICQSVTVTGSRLDKRRVCATAREWAARRQNDRDMAQRLQRELPLGPEIPVQMYRPSTGS